MTCQSKLNRVKARYAIFFPYTGGELASSEFLGRIMSSHDCFYGSRMFFHPGLFLLCDFHSCNVGVMATWEASVRGIGRGADLRISSFFLNEL